MIIKCGNDLVKDSRIQKKSLNRTFLSKVFQRSELATKSTQKLASVFSLKEATFKALQIPSKHWLEIEINYHPNGKPEIRLSKAISPAHLQSIDCSVSHENGFTYAMVVVLLRSKPKKL